MIHDAICKLHGISNVAMLVSYLKLRDRGFKIQASLEPYLYGKIRLWKSLASTHRYNNPHSSVFNVEFNPSGSYLIAACEKRTILVFDCITHKKITEIFPAHSDCVNVVRFLDNRLFLSCSDDCTVGLWDFRNMKTRLRTLKGHRNLVKSIEYSPEKKLLITSAFDDTVRLWDLDAFRSYPDDEMTDYEVYYAKGISRLKLSPDGQDLAIATIDGKLFIIRNLNLINLKDGLPTTFFNGCLMPALIPSDSFLNPSRSGRARAEENSFEAVRTFPDELFDVSEEYHRHGLYAMDFHPQSSNIITRFTLADKEYSPILELLSTHSLNMNFSMENCRWISTLTHYKVEANFKPCVDYIKEIGFGAEGRLICSPYGFGVRLLSYNKKCSPYEFSEPVTSSSYYPMELNSVQLLHGHNEACLTSRWSPFHMLVASGGMDGNIIFHQPKIT